MSGGGSDPGDAPAARPVAPRGGALQALRREWPLAVTLGGVLAGLLVAVVFDRFRRGVVLMSAAVVFAGWLRALLPESRIGLLRVRSRRIDVAALFVLGVGLLVLALAVPGVA
jgi:uncharacterized membrane protein